VSLFAVIGVYGCLFVGICLGENPGTGRQLVCHEGYRYRGARIGSLPGRSWS